MQIRFIVALACIAFIVGCAKEPSVSALPPAAISAFPATLEGDLKIRVTNDWGYFGDIVVAEIEHPIAIPASIFDASGVTEIGGKVRVVVASREDGTKGSYQYIASSITKL